MADKAYIGSRHCLTAGKKQKGLPETPKAKLFSKLLSHRRARVERPFAWLHRHRMLKETSRKRAVVSAAFHAVFLAKLVSNHFASGWY